MLNRNVMTSEIMYRVYVCVLYQTISTATEIIALHKAF